MSKPKTTGSGQNPPRPPMIFEGTGCANGTEYSAKLKAERSAADQPVFLSRGEALYILGGIPTDSKLDPMRIGLREKLRQAFPE